MRARDIIEAVVNPSREILAKTRQLMAAYSATPAARTPATRAWLTAPEDSRLDANMRPAAAYLKWLSKSLSSPKYAFEFTGAKKKEAWNYATGDATNQRTKVLDIPLGWSKKKIDREILDILPHELVHREQFMRVPRTDMKKYNRYIGSLHARLDKRNKELEKYPNEFDREAREMFLYFSRPEEAMAHAFDFAQYLKQMPEKLSIAGKIRKIIKDETHVGDFLYLYDALKGTPAWNRFLKYVYAYASQGKRQ